MGIRANHRLIPWGHIAGLVLFTTTVAKAQDFKPPLARLELADGDSVVFLGDSITHQCLYTQYVEDYYYTRYPGLKIRFHNAGVGGARARDALDRFDRDVAAYKPKYVTVLLGMNDGSYQPYDEKTFQTYRTDMTELVQKIREIGATPILMTPTMYDSRAARVRDPKAPPGRLELYNSTLAYYGAWLREVAVESGAGFVDMYSPLNNLTAAARKTDPNFTLIKDAVHPDPPGQLVMAYALLHDLGAPQTIFDIRAEVGGSGEIKVHLTGAGGSLTVSDASAGARTAEFQFGAAALPFVVPAEAEPGAKLVHLGHVLGRAALAVAGLQPGYYDLTIDGESIGIYSAPALAQGIELQSNSKTPDYKLAFQIAELNRNRNSGPVRNLRNEWSQMQQFYHLQRQVRADPNNAEAAKNLEAQAKKVERLEDRIAKHEREADAIESQIRAISRPAPHKYRVAAVETGSCNGKVVLNGKPLADAEILFEGDLGRAASGRTGKDGTFVMKISEQTPVVAPGQYRVVIQAKGVPAKYSDVNATPLRVEIRDASNTVSFELVD